MLEVYWVPVPESAAVGQVSGQLQILDPEELATYQRYRVDFKKVEFMTGRLLLKRLLAARLGTSPEQVRFAKNQYGRPQLHPDHGETGLFFNLSHTHGSVACVLSSWPRAGIDVERPEPGHLEVMPTVFLPPEIDFINSRPSVAEKVSAFGLLWTRKEAVMKAEGMGFHLAPKTFTVPFDWDSAADGGYLYRTCRLDSDTVCSLALSRDAGAAEQAPAVQRVEFGALFAASWTGKEGVTDAASSFYA